MTNTPAEGHLFVVLGGTGDLMERKLLPALYHAATQGLVDRCRILGVARSTDHDDESYRAWGRAALAGVEPRAGADVSAWRDSSMHYLSIGKGTPEDYARLAETIRRIEAEHGLPGNRVFYLALPPGAFPGTIEGLGAAGLNRGPGWTRLVIEKPFGRDLDSARELNALAHRHFDERQIYRIDHYLGKETVQNLLVFRFTNPVFESLWSRDRIESVEITVAEDLGIGGRAGYYDRSGALRDMVQNHLTQLLTLLAMEVPAEFEADAIRHEKVKVLRSIAPIGPDASVLGQYTAGVIDGHTVPGYLDEEDVDDGSRTPSYVALRLEIDNWRWQGVPFYLRTGKRLPRRMTQVAVTFKRAPVSLFRPHDECEVHRNVLVLTLQPNEGFELDFQVKAPGEPFSLASHALDFWYREAFGALPDAYETLLVDVLTGDQTLFVRADEVEAAWALYAPVLDADVAVHPYPAGSWGPEAADEMLEQDGQRWIVRATEPS